MPLYRGWKTFCVDANTGEGIWNITSISQTPAIADGYLVELNLMDHNLYAFGKGPTKITIAGPEDVQPLGKSVLITGIVTDESPGMKQQDISTRFPNGVPAIADEYMSEWMEFVYKQLPCPMMLNGVEVKLETLDPNGNFYEIGTVTSDASGMYKLMWEPQVPGEYTIIATFAGSESYFSSYVETAIGVEEGVPAGSLIEPESTTPEVAESTAESPLITTEIAIIAAVAVACIVGIVSFWALRKRK